MSQEHEIYKIPQDIKIAVIRRITHQVITMANKDFHNFCYGKIVNLYQALGGVDFTQYGDLQKQKSHESY